MKVINHTVKNSIMKNESNSSRPAVDATNVVRKNLRLKTTGTVYFGANPTYFYGHIYRNKFMTPYKGYSIVEELYDSGNESPSGHALYSLLFKQKYNCALGKLVDGEISLFFPGSIFNTFVISVEETVSTLFSCDRKLTVIRGLLDIGRIYVVRIVKENEKRREVKLADVYTSSNSTEHSVPSSIYPGLVLTGTVDFVSNKPFVTTPIGGGSIVLQNNDMLSRVKCVLYGVGNTLQFAQIGNPISNATVKSIASMDSIQVVEDGNIKGILLNPCHNSSVYDVLVEKVLIGSYIFVEGIKKTNAVVRLIKKVEASSTPHSGDCSGNINEIIGPFWEVSYKVGSKEYLGICRDKKVGKKMKGRIVRQISIGEYKYEFTQSEDITPMVNTDSVVHSTYASSIAVDDSPPTDSASFLTVDQLIDQINSLSTYQQILKLLNTYIPIVDNPDRLCVIYLKKLEEMGEINSHEINKILRIRSKKDGKASDNTSLQGSERLTYAQFIDGLFDELEDIEILEYLYEKRSSKNGFKKILKNLGNGHKTMGVDGLSFDQVDFIMKNINYFNFAIEFIYENIESPANTVQKIMGLNQKWLHPENGAKSNAHCKLDSFKNWLVLLKYEQDKSSLFEAALGKAYSKIEMKQIFSKWYEFESSRDGNVERVKELAREYKEKSTQQ